MAAAAPGVGTLRAGNVGVVGPRLPTADAVDRSCVPRRHLLGSGHASHLGRAAPSAASDPEPFWSLITNTALHGVVLLAMIAAMSPLVAANARFVALRTPRRTRWGTAMSLLGGWCAVWALAVVPLACAAWLLGQGLGAPAAALAATSIAVGWQGTGWKRRSLGRCHRVFAPPLPLDKARRSCRAFGRGLGVDCVSSCAPMMVLMMVSNHSVMMAAPLTGVAYYERRHRPHHDPDRAGTSFVIALVGCLAALLLWLGLL